MVLLQFVMLFPRPTCNVGLLWEGYHREAAFWKVSRSRGGIAAMQSPMAVEWATEMTPGRAWALAAGRSVELSMLERHLHHLISIHTSAPFHECITKLISHEMPVALPQSAWQILCLVFRKVEASCKWPWQLEEVAAVAIPKAGQTGVAVALKQRIISVTSQVYRVWATCRATQLNQGWLRKAMPPEIFGGVPGLSAKTASFSEGVSWDSVLY